MPPASLTGQGDVHHRAGSNGVGEGLVGEAHILEVDCGRRQVCAEEREERGGDVRVQLSLRAWPWGWVG